MPSSKVTVALLVSSLLVNTLLAVLPWSFQKRNSWSEQKRKVAYVQRSLLVNRTTGSFCLSGRSLSIETLPSRCSQRTALVPGIA